MTENKIEKLFLMLSDMQQQSDLYKPTTFWIAASKIIIDDIEKHGIEDFRRLSSSLGMFTPVYSYLEYLQDNSVFDDTKAALALATTDLRSNLKLDMLFTGRLQAFADYRVLVAGNRDYAPYTDRISESTIGNPIEQFSFDGRNFSRSFLNYLLGLSFLKQHVDTSEIKVVMEIGGGFGTLGEILLGDDRNNYFYINADIPPTSFVSGYYLKKLFGDVNIADYGDLYEHDILDITALQKKYQALNICSWQVPKLRGKIDLFVNFISFQEMEPDVVQNYCNYINLLQPSYILLRNIAEGKKKKDNQTVYGVKTPIIENDYDTFLPDYKLLVSDSKIFGHQTEDNFHSQLRLYKRK